jgi:hypothetical protein
MDTIGIHRELCAAVYGQNVMSEGTVRQWCTMFKDVRTNVHDEERSSCPSAVCDDLGQSVDQKVCERRCFKISEVSCEFPQISRTVLYEIITIRLGYHKFCARWVSKMLTAGHKKQRMASAFADFLERSHKDGDVFINHSIRVTGDETWVSFMNVETKEQSKQSMHTHSPNQPKKFKQKLSVRKLMAAVFWDRKGVLVVEFMQQGGTITSEVYRETLTKMSKAIQNKMRGMLTFGVMLLHDMRVGIQLLALEHCWSISTGSYLTTLLTSLISLRATTTCLSA